MLNVLCTLLISILIIDSCRFYREPQTFLRDHIAIPVKINHLRRIQRNLPRRIIAKKINVSKPLLSYANIFHTPNISCWDRYRYLNNPTLIERHKSIFLQLAVFVLANCEIFIYKWYVPTAIRFISSVDHFAYVIDVQGTPILIGHILIAPKLYLVLKRY